MADLYPPVPITRESPPTPANPEPSPSSDSHKDHKESKPQATFLTKLYALLERPENHHMIRWDEAGQHIIVEKPEALALHVLPSIYRQSRFASFSRQLNIYGWMRKVNLRNVDPAIDDPDASTWSHPTLNRNSPPEVVANFKRRVPPRIPKPRKREPELTIPPPRTALGLGPGSLPMAKQAMVSRPRGFSSPGTYPPSFYGSQPRQQLPPLNVPPGHHSGYSMSPGEESPSSIFAFSSTPRDVYPAYADQNNWSYNNTSSSHSSLHSILNHGAAARAGVQSSPYSTLPMEHMSQAPGHDSRPNTGYSSVISHDSRPNTGYSVSSVTSTYEDNHNDYSSRPNSSYRPISPMSRPSSASSRSPSGMNLQSGMSGTSLSVRRVRSKPHGQAMNPYPSPMYEQPRMVSNGGMAYDQRTDTNPMSGIYERPFDAQSRQTAFDHQRPNTSGMYEAQRASALYEPQQRPSTGYEQQRSHTMFDVRPSTSGGIYNGRPSISPHPPPATTLPSLPPASQIAAMPSPRLGGLRSVRSMIQLPSVNNIGGGTAMDTSNAYAQANAHAEFAYGLDAPLSANGHAAAATLPPPPHPEVPSSFMTTTATGLGMSPQPTTPTGRPNTGTSISSMSQHSGPGTPDHNGFPGVGHHHGFGTSDRRYEQQPQQQRPYTGGGGHYQPGDMMQESLGAPSQDSILAYDGAGDRFEPQFGFSVPMN